MSPLLFLAVAAAGGAGAGARYLLELAVQRIVGTGYPWGTLAVNLTGALALGILSGGVAGTTGLWLLGTGLLGGYTTFSSVAATTALLAEDRRARAAVSYAAVTFLGSVALAGAGLALGAALS